VSDSSAGISAITVPLLPSFKGVDSGTVDGVYLDVTSGLKQVFKKLMDAGGSRSNLRIWLVGAAAFMDEPKELSLGVHIYAAAKKILKTNGLKIHAEHVGGSFDRSVFLEAGADVLTVVMPEGREITI
jgi:chemotaxis receptor (MCP) glutamine deamidase CheD